ncbi:MAG TPA: hypothetical protein VJ785_14945 [Anaerolineales bacterium]|nr:hypothetical protein [Anaerolineales bacterium]
MQPRPSFDRALLIPIAIGVLSILGIGWILLTSVLGRSSIPPTVTPPSLISLETRLPTPSPAAARTQEEPLPTETGPESYPAPLTDTPSSTSTSTEIIPTPSATLTPGRIQPLRAGKYDDTNPNIAYDKNWTALKNPGTENAYKGTLHASTGNGNQASFRFTGDGFRLGYQRGRNFGTVTVLIDDQPYSFHEQAFDLVWRSPQLPPGDHFVRIIHQSGETINLDYIEILD